MAVALAYAPPLAGDRDDAVLLLDVLEHVPESFHEKLRRRACTATIQSSNSEVFSGQHVPQRTTSTGLGITELVNLPLLVLCRYMLASECLYQILQYADFLAYLLEGLLPPGRIGYHLMVIAAKDQVLAAL